jgi:Protein of unknown function (DUF1688)
VAHSLVSEREVALTLLSADAVRERSHEMLTLALADTLPNFRVDLCKLEPIANFVADVIRETYPDLNVPPRARWRHFVFGGRDLWAEIARKSRWPDTSARARAEFDLATASVLLDAGAGPEWRYHDAETGIIVGRSEGLALAGLRMFEAGLFSSDRSDPLRADAGRLAVLTGEDLAKGFQSNDANPLVGLDGRAALLARLGHHALAKQDVFAKRDSARAGGLFDHLAEIVDGGAIAAPAILHELLIQLAPIWPSRLMLGGISLGDTWRHRAIMRNDASSGFVPLHKLSQWLSYSLIEPLQTAGIAVTDVDDLTGLAEYRNGGLFMDGGVIALRDPTHADRAHPIDSELVIEWRALTIALLDGLASLIREKFGLTAQAFPLGALLEGGTWAAGRRLASQKRPDCGAPLQVISDGTVF